MKLLLLVGPPGSGKSTLARKIAAEEGYVYVNQDSQGYDGHKEQFIDAVYSGKPVIVDRMNFNKQQRLSFIEIAKLKGYSVKVIIKCESSETCLARMLVREGHETIKDEKSARSALQMFMTKYEPPTTEEGIDEIERLYPETLKPLAIYSDLDGTLCDVEHRTHHVRRTDGAKKDWKSFFEGISEDPVVWPVMHLLMTYARTHKIVYCTGRDSNYRKVTQDWLNKFHAPEGELFMRHRNDSRQDYLVKEVLLDFEVLTRYKILFCLDDRDQVVQMLRRRGLTVFQVANGDF